MQDVDTFLVNLLDSGSKRYLKVNMQLKLNSEQVKIEFTQRASEFRDTILMLLSNKESEDISTIGGKQALKREIMKQINRLLKDGQVLDVYFNEFLVQ